MANEELFKQESATLSSYAVMSSSSEGREFEENRDDERLPFQKDKDRVVHSRAFRRLEAKTQVFKAGSGDHYRTRLTHTLEVAQVGRDIARRLGLNEDLCEVIALSHDLGHPPFGHAGEDALDEIMREHGSHFEHNEQSLRVVTKLERAYPGFRGLNLSKEVLSGLVKHQTAFDQAGKQFEVFPHLEAQVVNVADEIAYTNHDIDDGLRSRLITLEQLRKLSCFRMAEESVEKKYGKIKEERIFVSRVISHLISIMIDDFCVETDKNLQANSIKSLADVRDYKGVLATFSSEMRSSINELRKFLYDNFYMSDEVVGAADKGKMMIRKLFEYYLEDLSRFPKPKFLEEGEKAEIVIKDYIAGMTDIFLRAEFNKI